MEFMIFSCVALHYLFFVKNLEVSAANAAERFWKTRTRSPLNRTPEEQGSLDATLHLRHRPRRAPLPEGKKEKKKTIVSNFSAAKLPTVKTMFLRSLRSPVNQINFIFCFAPSVVRPLARPLVLALGTGSAERLKVSYFRE